MRIRIYESRGFLRHNRGRLFLQMFQILYLSPWQITLHIIVANEVNAIAIGAGYYLSIGKVTVVYMQNSGQGNAVNPLHPKVYGISEILIIGWRGVPGIVDELQHSLICIFYKLSNRINNVKFV